MRPVNVDPPRPLDGQQVIYAEDQPEYLPLPAWRRLDGCIITRWRPSIVDRLRLLFGRDLYLEVMTFNHPLQPIRLSTAWEDVEGR